MKKLRHFIGFTLVATAIAAGIAYVLQYKNFHK